MLFSHETSHGAIGVGFFSSRQGKNIIQDAISAKASANPTEGETKKRGKINRYYYLNLLSEQQKNLKDIAGVARAYSRILFSKMHKCAKNT